MSRLKGKIPRIRFAAFEPISLTDANWRTVEAAYGLTVAREARAQVTQKTNEFLQFALAEDTGLMDDAIMRAKRLRKGAQSFLATINERAVEDVTRGYVDDTLAESDANLNRDERLATRKYVEEISTVLSRFVNACDLTLQVLDAASQHNYWPDGGAWEAWIRDLTYILEQHNLPIAVRKDNDKDKSNRPSPFLEFVHTFQNYIPKEQIRAKHSKGALAQAIHKARHGSKSPVAPRKRRAQ